MIIFNSVVDLFRYVKYCGRTLHKHKMQKTRRILSNQNISTELNLLKKNKTYNLNFSLIMRAIKAYNSYFNLDYYYFCLCIS